MYESLRLTNFTAFTDARFEFVSGINVLVGPNATGKTHVMKALYALQSAVARQQPVGETLVRVFNPDALGRLVHRRRGVTRAQMLAVWNGEPLEASFSSNSKSVDISGTWREVTTPVYIPPKDMLAHSVGFLSLYDTRALDYEAIYADIVRLSFLPQLRGAPDQERASLLESLRRQTRGAVSRRGERFYLNTRAGNIEMPLVAEGRRKLALLHILIQNGSLSNATVLFWDEPESNLNPSAIADLVAILLRLERLGVQIFLATHNYVVLKELELQKTAEHKLRIFGLSRLGTDGEVVVQAVDEYVQLSPNPIADEFLRLYDLEVRRALEGTG